MKTKTLLERIWNGVKKGYTTPNLPEDKIKLQLHPLIRILRLIGGLSFLVIVGKSYVQYDAYVLYLAMFFSILFLIYHIVISYYRFKHIIITIKSDELDIRN